MRKTYIWQDGEFVEVSKARRNSPRIHVIQDTMEPTAHPCTGKLMDSKSEFRRTTKMHGCIEVGNEPLKDRREWKMPPVRETLREVLERHGR